MPPISEQVSGNTVEFEMTSLTPATEYTVNVYAIRNQEKSVPATTDFTTGEMQSQSAITSAAAPPIGHTRYSFTALLKSLNG